MRTHFHRKSSVFPVIKNSNFQIFPKSSPRPFCGVRKCGKKLEKHRISFEIRCFYGCGGRTRTYDLRVMSPTSFQLLYSAIFRHSLECLGIIAHGYCFVKTFLCELFPNKISIPIFIFSIHSRKDIAAGGFHRRLTISCSAAAAYYTGAYTNYNTCPSASAVPDDCPAR